MENKKSIALDMDGVLANNMAHYIAYYFEETGQHIAPSTLVGLPENACLPDETAVRRYLEHPGFFRTLPVSTNAQEVVRALHERYDLFVVSAAMEFPFSLRDKYDWLAEYFPFISWRNIVFCGDKSIIHTDYLLDDHVKNLKTFAGVPLLFDAFHNAQETEFERLKDWNAVATYFLA
ncbi:5'(3')-deoxyribonucleotidase [Sphingobacterium oryzagri]|uniref:5'(3')-deoxyribonucleotidase n=1 Tax=Sphingobacterium oryzagri TaxID=3025669 RepID=A0ABY7WF21_9SPHI|nr:5'(3')-deoxyribonucleotidase [Sphingobacterium sp. KACC 22765]WDF67209.1 5'(3')-deoxyribonucleotidase [Sphingobacterium sp. KACC 22765]